MWLLLPSCHYCCLFLVIIIISVTKTDKASPRLRCRSRKMPRKIIFSSYIFYRSRFHCTHFLFSLLICLLYVTINVHLCTWCTSFMLFVVDGTASFFALVSFGTFCYSTLLNVCVWFALNSCLLPFYLYRQVNLSSSFSLVANLRSIAVSFSSMLLSFGWYALWMSWEFGRVQVWITKMRVIENGTTNAPDKIEEEKIPCMHMENVCV